MGKKNKKKKEKEEKKKRKRRREREKKVKGKKQDGLGKRERAKAKKKEKPKKKKNENSKVKKKVSKVETRKKDKGGKKASLEGKPVSQDKGLSFQDFIEDNPSCKNPDRLEGFEKLFDFINQEDRIEKMVQEEKYARPALGAIVLELEELNDKQETPSFDLRDVYTRTSIGRMVSFVLGSRGFKPRRNKTFAKGLGFKYFLSASVFERVEEVQE